MLVTLTYEIPIPPSVDSMYRNVPGRGRVKTARYNAWSEETSWRLVSQGIKSAKIAPPVGIALTIFGGKGFSVQSDVSNRYKAAEDAIVASKLIADDNVRFVHRTSAEYVPPQGKKDIARAVVVITELQNNAAAAPSEEGESA